MYKSVLVFLILLITVATARAQDSHIKIWDEANPLRWEDFQGPVDSSSRFTAETSSGDSYKYHWHQYNGNFSFSFEVVCTMNMAKSWVKAGKESPELLRHEQVHFDISEFFARKLLEVFKNYHYTSKFKDEIIAIESEMRELRQQVQAKYDEETAHGVNRPAQAKWEIFVADLLKNNYTLAEALSKVGM